MKKSGIFSYIISLFKSQTTENNLSRNIINTEPAPVIPSVTNTVETDTVHRRRIKKLRKSIEQQLEDAKIRALKSHAPECSDMWKCTDSPCFKRSPDKIVGVPYKVTK